MISVTQLEPIGFDPAVTDPPYSASQRQPCERGQAMITAAQNIFARDGNVTEAELMLAGFTVDEICEYTPDVKRALMEANRRPPDRFPQLAQRFRDGIPSQPPMMDGDGNELTEKQLWNWHRYCRAYAALKIDPTQNQRIRVFEIAKWIVRSLPLLPTEALKLETELAKHFQKIINQAGAQ
ncbi:MAG: hypothetical protein AAGG69_02170 [Pseudomonadota bacterium]